LNDITDSKGGEIRPVIDSVFSFEDAKAGLSHYAGRKVTGKVVIRH